MNKLIGSAGMKLAYACLNSNPERNVPKLMDWIDRIAINNAMESQRKAYWSKPVSEYKNY